MSNFIFEHKMQIKCFGQSKKYWNVVHVHVYVRLKIERSLLAGKVTIEFLRNKFRKSMYTGMYVNNIKYVIHRCL